MSASEREREREGEREGVSVLPGCVCIFKYKARYHFGERHLIADNSAAIDLLCCAGSVGRELASARTPPHPHTPLQKKTTKTKLVGLVAADVFLSLLEIPEVTRCESAVWGESHVERKGEGVEEEEVVVGEGAGRCVQSDESWRAKSKLGWRLRRGRGDKRRDGGGK